MADSAGNQPALARRTTLRPISPVDEPFLRLVYAGTRAGEMAQVPWDQSRKDEFLRLQFDAQHRHYTDHFREAQFQIIELNGEAIGRLYIDRSEVEIHILDIALIPEKRNLGIGSALLREILQESVDTGRPVRIYVEHFNPALSLYKRLGFMEKEVCGVYFLMEWRSAEAAGAAASA